MSLQATDSTIYSGTCISVVGSKINHSCFPNVLYHPNKSSSLAIAIRPIKKGEQVERYLSSSFFVNSLFNSCKFIGSLFVSRFLIIIWELVAKKEKKDRRCCASCSNLLANVLRAKTTGLLRDNISKIL